MSYCRFGEGDVYLVMTSELQCMACRLIDEPLRYSETIVFTTRTEAIEHLQDHVDAGHKVPKHAFARLRREKKTMGDSLVWNEPRPAPKVKIKPRIR